MYFKITSFEAGIGTTGSRSANYHCYLEIFDGAGREISNHFLNDKFFGKWTKCEKVIRRWYKSMEKNKLQQLAIQVPGSNHEIQSK